MTTIRRRPLLGGTAVGAVSALLRPAGAAAHPGIGKARLRVTGHGAGGAIDVHAHLLPAYWRRTLPGGRAAGVPAPRWSPGRAVRHMDARGVGAQVLSLPDPVVSHLPDTASRLAMAQRVNDDLAALVEAHPTRFAALAVVPLGPDPAPAEVLTAVQEVQRALGLGLDGVSLLSNDGETYLGNPTLLPLMTALQALGAVVQVQGSVAGTRPRMELPAYLLESAFNATRAAVSMSYLQTFTATADVSWLFADAGGTLPYLAYRSSLLQLYPAAAQNLGISDLDDQNFDYGRLHFDTAHSNTAACTPALRSVAEVTEETNVLLGTDYPFERSPLPDVPRSVRAVYNAGGQDAIMRGNALRLFPRLA